MGFIMIDYHTVTFWTQNSLLNFIIILGHWIELYTIPSKNRNILTDKNSFSIELKASELNQFPADSLTHSWMSFIIIIHTYNEIRISSYSHP